MEGIRRGGAHEDGENVHKVHANLSAKLYQTHDDGIYRAKTASRGKN